MPIRLAKFEIEKLFDLYSHVITFSLEGGITIIIGPNGRGKTVCLKFIEALFQKKFGFFSDISFNSAVFTFTDGAKIRLDATADEGVDGRDGGPARSVRFVVSSCDQNDVVWVPSLIDNALMREIRRHIPAGWRQLGSSRWIDETDGEEIDTEEMIERYRLPPKIAGSMRLEMPAEFTRLIDQIDCHLIETQRLLVFPQEAETDPNQVYFGRTSRARRRVSRLAIQQKAEKLKSILGDTFRRYANLSQSLDRTFPLRVFDAQGSAKLSEQDLRKELKQLDERREALMISGILDTDYRSVSLRAGNIEPGVVMALEIYVKDTSSKLDIFNDIRSRIDLFKELIGTRFLDKTLHIDRENGFTIMSKNQKDVPLEKLSSGEQHQLILIFDLLFEVSANSLILIDEPELSLHVAWQKTFIESLSKIIALNAFDVLLATHSPAIVARHFDLAVELAPVDD